MSRKGDSVAIEPRGLRRETAARYLGISPSKFDEFVADGRLPGPKLLDGCIVWDRHRLDDAFEGFPDRDAAPTVNRWSRVAA